MRNNAYWLTIVTCITIAFGSAMYCAIQDRNEALAVIKLMEFSAKENKDHADVKYHLCMKQLTKAK